MKNVLFLIFVLLNRIVFAQVLTPEDAVNKAYKANFTIISAGSASKIVSIENSAGRAGMLPIVSLSGSWNGNNQNTNLTFNNGSEVSRNGAGSSSLNGGLQITQTVFNGFGMQAAKQRLKANEEAGFENIRNQKNAIREQVLNGYYLLVKEAKWTDLLQDLDTFYLEKLTKVQLMYDNGRASWTDVLQAKSDLIQQQVKTEERKSLYLNALSNLNYWMAENPDKQWDLAISDIPAALPMPDTSMAALLAMNPLLRQKKAEWDAAKQRIMEAKSFMYPTIQAGLTLNTLRSTSEVGVLLKNSTAGGGFQLSMNYPIYSGGLVKQDVAIAKLRSDMAELAYNQELLATRNQLHQALTLFLSLEKQSNMLKEATEIQKEVLDITAKSYLLGKSGRVELVQAQTTYETALTNYMEVSYNKMRAYHAMNRLMSVE